MDQMEFLEAIAAAEGIYRNGLPCGQTPLGVERGYAYSTKGNFGLNESE
jgi:hypothetical protein